ncbi:hypothetical protein CTAYLR_010479 [Chrysophaeum taylorii]|uniref:RAP domain-containing protein n=1 Tax=Chrysophaeum taylorii TaxID=2483200 RepID=A0AAD7UNK2_9STRA|nr:hypothetical protein CTAYLR_010479 [Chrysophaeum taylorii]
MEAPLWQQIEWGKAISNSSDGESVLSLFAAEGSRFNTRNLANAASRMAKAFGGSGGPHLLLLRDDERAKALARACRRRIREFNPQDLATTWASFAKFNIEVNEDARRLFDVVVDSRELSQFDAQELATTIWAFACAGRFPESLFTAAAELAVPLVDDMTAPSLANSTWAYAKAGLRAPLFFMAVADAFPRKSKRTPQDLTNAAWAFAKLGVEAPRLFGDIADDAAAAGSLASFEPQHLANLAWAFAKAGIEVRQLFGCIAESAIARIRDFKPQEVANISWAFATASVRAPRLFAAIADAASCVVVTHALCRPPHVAITAWAFAKVGGAPRFFQEVEPFVVARVRDFNERDLANTAWAFAKANRTAPRVFDRIAAVATPRLSDFNTQDLANTAWAFAKSNYPAPRLYHVLAKVIRAKRLDAFLTSQLTTIAWAFATAGVEAPRLFRAIAEVAPSRVPSLDAKVLSNVAWSFATAGVEAPDLFQIIAAAVKTRLFEFDTSYLSSTAWAFSMAVVSAPDLFDAIASEAGKKLDDFAPADLANMAWAFASADWTTDPAFLKNIQATAVKKLKTFVDRNLSQLHLVLLHCRLSFPPDIAWPLDDFRATLLDAYKCSEPRPSRFQQDVAEVLDRIRWNYNFEHLTADGLSLDMAQPDTLCAIEVDGPTHYLRSTQRVLNAQTRLKSRLLKALGWGVSRVPSFEWELIDGDLDKQDAYVKRKIKLAMASARHGGRSVSSVATAQALQAATTLRTGTPPSAMMMMMMTTAAEEPATASAMGAPPSLKRAPSQPLQKPAKKKQSPPAIKKKLKSTSTSLLLSFVPTNSSHEPLEDVMMM